VERIRGKYDLSERQACRLVGQPRGTQRYSVIVRTDEDALTRAIVELASQYGRYGYRRIRSLLNDAGWDVGSDRVQRIWRREGSKYRRNRSHEAGYGSMTARASGSDRSGAIMSGPTTSSKPRPMTVAKSG